MGGTKLPALLNFSDPTTQSVLGRQQAAGYSASEGSRNSGFLGLNYWSVNDQINLEKQHPGNTAFQWVLNPYYDPHVKAQLDRLPNGSSVGQVPDYMFGSRIVQKSWLDSYNTPSSAPAAISNVLGNQGASLGTVPQGLTTTGLANYNALEQRQTFEPQNQNKMKLGA